MQETESWLYRGVATLLGLVMLVVSFGNYLFRFGTHDEQDFVYSMDMVLGALIGVPSFSLMESALGLAVGLACLSVWVRGAAMLQVLGLVMGAAYFAVLTQYAHYGGLPDQLVGYAVMTVAFAGTAAWAGMRKQVLDSAMRYPFLGGLAFVGLVLVVVSIRMAWRAPLMEDTFREYRDAMEFSDLELE